MFKQKITIFIICMMFVGTLMLKADSIDFRAEFDNATNYYEAKEYKKASEIYSKLIENGYNNFNVNFNKGSSSFELERYGEAKFYYLKALKKNPFDKELKTNIKVTYKKLGEDPSDSDVEIMSARMLYFFSPTVVFVLFIISIILVILSIILFRRLENRRVLIFFVVFSVLSLIFTTLYVFQYIDLNRKFFIVTSKETPCYVTPNSGDLVLVTLKEGAKLKIVDMTNNFIKTDLNNGLYGFVDKSKVVF